MILALQILIQVPIIHGENIQIKENHVSLLDPHQQQEQQQTSQMTSQRNKSSKEMSHNREEQNEDVDVGDDQEEEHHSTQKSLQSRHSSSNTNLKKKLPSRLNSFLERDKSFLERNKYTLMSLGALGLATAAVAPVLKHTYDNYHGSTDLQ